VAPDGDRADDHEGEECAVDGGRPLRVVEGVPFPVRRFGGSGRVAGDIERG
jgi:hypothetical protein